MFCFESLTLSPKGNKYLHLITTSQTYKTQHTLPHQSTQPTRSTPHRTPLPLSFSLNPTRAKQPSRDTKGSDLDSASLKIDRQERVCPYNFPPRASIPQSTFLRGVPVSIMLEIMDTEHKIALGDKKEIDKG